MVHIHLFLIIPPENSFYCPKLSQIFTICVVRRKFIGKRDLISYNLVATIPIINYTKLIIILYLISNLFCLFFNNMRNQNQ